MPQIYFNNMYTGCKVDEHHSRYFKYLKEIDPDFSSSITHFIVLDTPRLMNVHTYT